jgi:hypothetical protein
VVPFDGHGRVSVFPISRTFLDKVDRASGQEEFLEPARVREEGRHLPAPQFTKDEKTIGPVEKAGPEGLMEKPETVRHRSSSLGSYYPVYEIACIFKSFFTAYPPTSCEAGLRAGRLVIVPAAGFETQRTPEASGAIAIH